MGGRFSVLLNWAVTSSDACIADVITVVVGWANLNAGTRVGIGDDISGYAAELAVAVEQVVARLALSATRVGEANIAFFMADCALVDGDVIKVSDRRAGKQTDVTGEVTSVGDGTLSDAEVGRSV